VDAFKAVFEKHCSTKTLRKPPRSRLNANGVREIIPIEPEVDVTLSELELGAIFQEAGLPLHKQTLSHICSEAAGRRGVSFEGLLRLLQSEGPKEEEGQGDKEWEALFRVYDRRARGYFDFEDYRFVCDGITLEVSEAQMREAFWRLAEGRAVVRLVDFGRVMRGCSDGQ
jgi:Ca2+-binding EF-hand superfamily protein